MFVRATVALVGIALLGCITIILAEEYAMNIHKRQRSKCCCKRDSKLTNGEGE